jgi:SnoaL-like domain
MNLAEVVATYGEAWVADEAERRRLLEVAWHEDGVYSDPVGKAEGREALVSHIAGFQEQFPSHRIVVTSGVDEHDGCFRFSWVLTDADGNIIMEGVDFGEVADDGRIARVTGFFDPLPEVDPLDRMRHTGVGVEDANIVGNPGPTGVAPGEEADGGLLVDDPEGAREAET